MHASLAIRNGQSYDSLLERKHFTIHGDCSEDYIINEYTIAYFMLLVTCSLDATLATKRQKMALFEKNVCLLKKMDGQTPGGSNRRRELAEVLTKWHNTFKHVNKTRRDPTVVDPVLIIRIFLQKDHIFLQNTRFFC
jgi:hypothetical protein